MAGQHQSNSSAYRIVTVCTVLTIAYSILIIAVFLQLKGAVCSTTSSGVGLLIAVVSSTPGHHICRSPDTALVLAYDCCGWHPLLSDHPSTEQILPDYITLNSFAAAGFSLRGRGTSSCSSLGHHCLRQSPHRGQSTSVSSATTASMAGQPERAELEIWVSMPTTSLPGSIVCIDGVSDSVIILAVEVSNNGSRSLSITCLSFSDSVNQQQTRRGVSLISCYFTFRKPAKSHHSPRSVSSSQSWSTLGKDDPLYLIPERRSSQLEHDQWQHLRNSLSSQRAIYPLRYQWHDQRPRYASSGIAPGRYSATLGSVSEGYSLEPGDRNSSMTSSQSSRAWNTIPSTRPSTIASSHSRASSNPERGDLRREKISKSPAEDAKTPDVPPLPTLPPPTWAPTLYHAPLSADPTLRALSTGSAAVVVRPNLAHSKSSPDLLVQPLKIKKRQPKAPVAFPAAPTPAPRTTKESASKTLLSTSHPAPPMPSITPPPPPTALATPLPSHPPPTLPSRAPGHSARQRLALPPQPHPHASLRRPDALRHHQHSNLSISASPSQIHLPTHQYQHQRVWKYGGHHPGSGHTGGRDMSVYSMSSHGTNPATDSRVSYARG